MSERDEIARLMSVSAQPGYRWGSDSISDMTALRVADAILATGYTRTPALPAEGSPEEAAAVERMAIALYDQEEEFNKETEAWLNVNLGKSYTWAEHAERWPKIAEAYRRRARAAFRALAQGMAVPTSTEAPDAE